MSKEDNPFNSNYWGPEQLRPFVEYSKRGRHYCIYCGAVADTREHVPSRTFLKNPLPCDLPVLPACFKCNNGYSSDELYTRTYINCLKEVICNNNMDYLDISLDDLKAVREAKQTIKAAFDQKLLTYDKRVGRILLKLAIGHAVYELSEGYPSTKWSGIPLYTRYIVRGTVSEAEWRDLEYAEAITDQRIPEIGSRAYRNIYVVQAGLSSFESGSKLNANLVMLDWTDIQDGEYRYIAYFNQKYLIVKMILLDYLYGEVVFQEKSEQTEESPIEGNSNPN